MRCKGMFPATTEYFGKKKGVRDGLTAWCLCCIAQNMAERRAAEPKKPRKPGLNRNPPKGFADDWINGPWGMDKVCVIARILQVPDTFIYWAGEREDDMLKAAAGYRAITVDALKAEIKKFNRGTLDGDDEATAPAADPSPPADPEAVRSDSV